jgi:lipoprotein NlpI
MFLFRCCRKTNEDELLVKSNINEVIEIVYQIQRHGLRFTKYELPHICRYDFTQNDTLRPEMVNYFFYYLIKTHERRDYIRDALYSA